MADERDAVLRAVTGAAMTRSEADRMQEAMDRLDRADGPTTLRDAHRQMGRDFGREVSRPPVTPDRRSTRR